MSICLQILNGTFPDQMFFFQFEIIINVLVSSFFLILIPMLCVCGHYKCFTLSVRRSTFVGPRTGRVDHFLKANFFAKQKKWNESGFRPPLCTYRLNLARITSWGWWDDWDDTVLQTQDSKFKPWGSEAEHATSRSRRLHTILTFTRGWGRNIFVSFKPPRPGTEPRKAAVLTTTLGPPPFCETGDIVNHKTRFRD